VQTKLSFFLVIIAYLHIPSMGKAQIISYGDSDEALDTVIVARAAPEFIARGYVSLEDYLEEKLFQDIRTGFSMQAIGATALVSFTIDKNGYPKNVDVSSMESRLIFPLQTALDSMPRWKPRIKNDRNVKTKMEFYYLITQVEMGQFVVTPERMPPKFDKTTRNIKIVIITACVSALIAAWAIL
jgi:hypothetical protein